MISRVQGTVLTQGLHWLEVQVVALGVMVHVPPATAAACRVGSEVTLHTSLVVREDAWTMFGFSSPSDRDAFDTLRGVTGIGPKLALAVLSVYGMDHLARALYDRDVSALVKVPGVGKKSAERLILELRDKLGAPVVASASASDDLPLVVGWSEPVTEALVDLGWNPKQAGQAVAAVMGEVGEQADIPVALRACLQWLGR